MSNPQYLTIVYRITDQDQPRKLLEQSEWSAASHSHAMHERDEFMAALQYAVKQVPDLLDVPGIKAAITKATHS